MRMKRESHAENLMLKQKKSMRSFSCFEVNWYFVFAEKFSAAANANEQAE